MVAKAEAERLRGVVLTDRRERSTSTKKKRGVLGYPQAGCGRNDARA